MNSLTHFSTRRLVFVVLNILLLSGCATLPEVVDRPVTRAYTDTNDTLIGEKLASRKLTNSGQSGFYLLADGLDAFVARAILANSAERSIDVQYYLWHNDLVGQLFSRLLLDAADQGIRIRILLDDMALANGDTGALSLNTHPNVEVRIFNPFSRNVNRTSQFITRFGSVTRRMHNKSFTVDNQMSIIGGRNIGNEYFAADPDFAFGDLDVITVGPVVGKISKSFDLYWNHNLAYPISAFKNAAKVTADLNLMREKLDLVFTLEQSSDYLQALKNSQLAEEMRTNSTTFYWGSGDLMYDHPGKITADRDQLDLHLLPQLRRYGADINQELIIYSPYFVPGKPGVKRLRDLIDKGVRVRVLTNSLASTDVGVVHAGYARYRKAMLRAGVELYELNSVLTRKQRKEKKGLGGSSKASLHAKSFVLDRKRVFVGSLNIDPRSVVENTEIGVVIESQAMAGEMSDWFDQSIENIAFQLALEPNRSGGESIIWKITEEGVPRVYTSEPNAGFWRRLGVNLMRLLPIESQL